LKLKRVPKMINSVKKMQSGVFLVGFKAETGVSKKELVERAREKLVQASCDLVIANDIGTKRYRENPDYNNVIAVDSKTVRESGWKSKEQVVRFIREQIESRL
jgi:phosphopantothenoylcysteine decarboxylase/phosphopantothenate--cysteine ligase